MNRIFKNHSILSLVLVIVLIAAMALSVVSCDKEDLGNEETSAATEAVITSEAETETEEVEDEKTFDFTVVFVDGSSKTYTIKTTKATVGEALLGAGLIAGEDSQYGLYVKTVDGVTLDYDKDGKYWAFYVDGKYAPKGVDQTEIEEGKLYSFKAE